MSNNNMGIKLIGGLLGATLAGAYVADYRRRLKKDIAQYKKQEPYRLLDYMLSRVVVICPQCRHIVCVTTLEAQLASVWRCFKCGCAWEETSHCDIIIDAGGDR